MEFLRFLLEERPKQPIKHPIGLVVMFLCYGFLILERKKKEERCVFGLLLPRSCV